MPGKVCVEEDIGEVGSEKQVGCGGVAGALAVVVELVVGAGAY